MSQNKANQSIGCDVCSCVHHCQAKCMSYGPVEELAKKLADHPKQALYAL